MELQFNQGDHDIRTIKLIGKLDGPGTDEIEARFTGHCSGIGVRVVVDLSETGYLASTGIHLLLLTARSVARSGGRMVILNPVPEVKHALELAGIPAIIPIYSARESAETVLLAS